MYLDSGRQVAATTVRAGRLGRLVRTSSAAARRADQLDQAGLEDRDNGDD